MDVKSQNSRSHKKGRDPKLQEKQKKAFFKKCRKLRDEGKAVTIKYAQKLISQLTAISGKKWILCETTIGNIFRANGWNLRKSQKRNLSSDPNDK